MSNFEVFFYASLVFTLMPATHFKKVECLQKKMRYNSAVII